MRTDRKEDGNQETQEKNVEKPGESVLAPGESPGVCVGEVGLFGMRRTSQTSCLPRPSASLSFAKYSVRPSAVVMTNLYRWPLQAVGGTPTLSAKDQTGVPLAQAETYA